MLSLIEDCRALRAGRCSGQCVGYNENETLTHPLVEASVCRSVKERLYV